MLSSLWSGYRKSRAVTHQHRFSQDHFDRWESWDRTMSANRCHYDYYNRYHSYHRSRVVCLRSQQSLNFFAAIVNHFFNRPLGKLNRGSLQLYIVFFFQSWYLVNFIWRSVWNTWKPMNENTTTLAYIEVAQLIRQTVIASFVESFLIGL